jgi:hypothetical protein
MPPRYAYWTILIDNGATAFRAKEQSELLPTLHQLRRTNKDVVMKWFANGRLWDSPDDARRARELRVQRERRGRDWRPGGEHKDPRARFVKPKGSSRSESREPGRARSAKPRQAQGTPPSGENAPRPRHDGFRRQRRPPRGKPSGPPRRR